MPILIPILGIVFGVGGPTLLIALCFPSIRQAVTRRLAGRSASDDEAIVTLQIRVRALEGEVDRLSHLLPGARS